MTKRDDSWSMSVLHQKDGNTMKIHKNLQGL